jgi:hypothetical protein
MRVTWAARSRNLDRVFGGGAADKLAARGKLGRDLKLLVDSGRVRLITGFHAESVQDMSDGICVTGWGPSGTLTLPVADRIIVATGQRPDLALTRELRLDLDPWLESPRALGPLIDPNLHSCGTVPPHGHNELSHPEPGYFAAGIKSYGRAPTFLMATGYEQVRSITALLAGDRAAADDVRLVLPETGVCSANISPAALASEASGQRGNSIVRETADGCCGGPAPAQSDACCAEDAKAKVLEKAGCGCGTAA